MNKVNKRFYQNKNPENFARETQQRIKKPLQVHSEAVIFLCNNLKPGIMKYSILFQQIGRKSPRIHIRQDIYVSSVLDSENIKIPEGYKIVSITSFLPDLHIPSEKPIEKKPRPRIK
jgi:hypothetical protein